MNFIEVEIKNDRFSIEGCEFVTPCHIDDKKVFIGIRPEKMLGGENSINVKPEMVEMIGSEKIVYFKLNGAACTAKVGLTEVSDSALTVKLSERDMYFFEAASGENILCKQS